MVTAVLPDGIARRATRPTTRHEPAKNYPTIGVPYRQHSTPTGARETGCESPQRGALHHLGTPGQGRSKTAPQMLGRARGNRLPTMLHGWPGTRQQTADSVLCTFSTEERPCAARLLSVLQIWRCISGQNHPGSADLTPIMSSDIVSTYQYGTSSRVCRVPFSFLLCRCDKPGTEPRRACAAYRWHASSAGAISLYGTSSRVCRVPFTCLLFRCDKPVRNLVARVQRTVFVPPQSRAGNLYGTSSPVCSVPFWYLPIHVR